MYSNWFRTIILFKKQYFPCHKTLKKFFLCPLGMNQFSQQPDHKNYHQEMGGNCLSQKQKNRITNAPSKLECGLIEPHYMHWIINVN